MFLSPFAFFSLLYKFNLYHKWDISMISLHLIFFCLLLLYSSSLLLRNAIIIRVFSISISLLFWFDMGAGDSSQLLSLCRERKELVRAARDCHYDLATAHIMYFQSLLDVGNTLNQFIEDELKINVGSSLEEFSDEDSHLKFPPTDSESELGSLIDYVHGDSVVSDGPKLSMQKNRGQTGGSSNLQFMKSCSSMSSTDSESELGSLTDYVHADSEVSDGPKLSTPMDLGPTGENSNVQLMKSSSPVSSTVFEHPAVVPVTLQGQDSLIFFHRNPWLWNVRVFGDPTAVLHIDENRYAPNNNNEVKFHVPTGFPHDDIYYPQDDNRVSVGATVSISQNNDRYSQSRYLSYSRAPRDFLHNDRRFPYNGRAALFDCSVDIHNDYSQTPSSPSVPLVPPSPLPMPKASAWDFLYPFNMVDDIYFCNFTQDTYEKESTRSNHEFRKVRKNEGIPDLEDEFEQHLVAEVHKEMRPQGDTKGSSGDGNSRVAAIGTNEDAQLSQEQSVKIDSNNVEEKAECDSYNLASKSMEEELATVQGIISEVDHGLTQDYDSLELSSSTTLNNYGRRDLLESVKEIRDAFETAFSYGKEVSILLEAGRLRYKPIYTKLKAFALRILHLLVPSVMMSSQRSKNTFSNRLDSRKMKVAKFINGNFEEHLYRRYGDLSSTLEKLYLWEKKLYKEVMGEEKLRVIYNKKCRKLEILDDRGADFSKIDRTHASIRRLLSKINVAVTAVDMISRRIHMLRDEELHPQLNELLEGLIKMWKCVLKCHQKQLQAIIGISTCLYIVKAEGRKDSSLKTTLKLEKEMLNWGTCFTDYIKTQKAFAKFLNEWLLRCLLEEPEETPDGIAPFSPSRITAPPVFIVCNDWYRATEKILETEVSKAIHDFASSLHQLWHKQDEEYCQRLKAENLSEALGKHLRYLHENEMNLNQNATAAQYHTELGAVLVGEVDMDLLSFRKKLDEQKAKHEEAIRQANDAASGSLEGLVPIFKALERFCVENLKAYELVRIPNAG